MVYAENQIPSQIDRNRLASDSQTLLAGPAFFDAAGKGIQDAIASVR
jgi:hypothetical protein